MRKLTAILLAAFMLLSLAACGSNEQTPPAQGVIERPQRNETTDSEVSAQPEDDTDQPESGATENTDAPTGSNILIAYFTVPETDGVDTVANASRVATDNGVVGNTEFIAMEIQKNLGGDLFAIETVQEYPGSHDPLLELPTMKRAMTQGRSFLHILIVWMVMTIFSLATPTGMPICLCRYTHFLKNTIFPARRSFPL